MHNMKGLAAFLFVLASAPAISVPVTYDFSGQVTYIGTSNTSYHPPIETGTAFTGFFTFDDTLQPNFTGATWATWVGAISEFQVDYSGLVVRGAEPGGYLSNYNSLFVSNDREGDGYDGISVEAPIVPLPGDPEGLIRYVTWSALNTGNAFSSTAIPDPIPGLGAWFLSSLSLNYMIFNPEGTEVTANGDISGALTSLSRRDAHSVPEPSTLALVLASLAAMAWVRRWKGASVRL